MYQKKTVEQIVMKARAELLWIAPATDFVNDLLSIYTSSLVDRNSAPTQNEMFSLQMVVKFLNEINFQDDADIDAVNKLNSEN